MSDKLDHETESVIEEFAVEEWLSGKKMTNHASDARDAVRQRIRVLVDEGEKASWLLGYDEGFEAGEIGVPND